MGGWCFGDFYYFCVELAANGRHAKKRVQMLGQIRHYIAALGLLAAMSMGAATLTHKVQPGETVYSLSRRYGVTVETLIKYNPRARDGIKAGEILVLPDNGTAKPWEAAPELDKTYHTIQKGESLYGIAKRYGMSVDQLLELNPSVDANGYSAGTVLRLRKDTAVPVVKGASTSKAEATPKTEPKAEVEPKMETRTEPKVEPKAEPKVEPEVAEVVEESVTPSVVIMLPFMSDTPAPKDKGAQHATDYLRGFMIAADTLSHKGGKVDIVVLDTYDSLDTVKSLLRRPEVKRANVIVAPSDTLQLQAIAASAAGSDTWVLNLFAVKDATFMHNGRVIQGNIPHDEMYGKAIDAFVSRFGDYTPVFIKSENADRNDKGEFTDMLRRELDARGRDYIELSYSGYLSAKVLEGLDAGGKYVFVPSSATRAEFKRFAPALKHFSEGLSDPRQVRVFGYPDWILFKGDLMDNLCALNAMIYSRFYLDPLDHEVRQLASQFLTHYGREMIEVYPSQGALGYDTGVYVIKALRNGAAGRTFGKAAPGVQTPISLDYDNVTGPVNTGMYLIEYLPGGYVEKTVL